LKAFILWNVINTLYKTTQPPGFLLHAHQANETGCHISSSTSAGFIWFYYTSALFKTKTRLVYTKGKMDETTRPYYGEDSPLKVQAIKFSL
jgi:hypothetical protein